MLTKNKDVKRIRLAKGVKPFENVACQGRIQNFFQGVAPNFVTSSSILFSGRVSLTLKNLNNKNNTRGVLGHAAPKNFENLHTVMAVLVLFELFSSKVSSYFWLLTLSASPNMMHFVCTVSSMRA